MRDGTPHHLAVRRRAAVLGGVGSLLLGLARAREAAALEIAAAPAAAEGSAPGGAPGSTLGVEGTPRPAPDRVNLMFCGDSLAQGMFLTLNPALRRRPGLRIINGALHATGVTRADEYDWPSVSRELVERHRPNLLVYWIGANDFRPLVVRALRARYQFGTQAFADLYGQRVAEMVGNGTQAQAKVVWLGLPNMREASFAGAARQLNAIQQAAAEAAGAIWVETWQATSDAEGRYLPALATERATRNLRAEDGVHFTDFGYRRIATLLFDAVGEHFPELAAGLGRLTEA